MFYLKIPPGVAAAVVNISNKMIENLGFGESKIMKCLFILFHTVGEKCGQPRAPVTAHVDDAVLTGDGSCDSVWAAQQSKLSFGKCCPHQMHCPLGRAQGGSGCDGDAGRATGTPKR